MGEIVTHALDQHQLSSRYGLGGVPAGLHRHDGVVGPVYDESGYGHGSQGLLPVAWVMMATIWRPVPSGREAAVVGSRGDHPGPRFVEGKPRSCHRFEKCHHVLDVWLPAPEGRERGVVPSFQASVAGDPCCRWWSRLRSSSERGRGGESQRSGRSFLPLTHRRYGPCGSRGRREDPLRRQPYRPGCRVDCSSPSRERPEIRHSCLIEFRGETRIPVIEPDDVMTPP